MDTLSPIYTANLFAPLHAELLVLLRGLHDDDWQRPTIAGRWRVRDVAAHLLDNDLRRLAAGRDGHPLAPDRPITSARDLGRFVNVLNAEGVSCPARLSPRLLVELLETSGAWVIDLLSG